MSKVIIKDISVIDKELLVDIELTPVFVGDRWNRFTAEVEIMAREILSKAATDTTAAIKQEMLSHTKTGAMLGGFTSMTVPIKTEKGYWIGVGSISELDAATRYNMRNAAVMHGYWFNVEFGRNRVKRKRGEHLVFGAAGLTRMKGQQDNPGAILPLWRYREVNPQQYLNSIDATRAISGDMGMQPSRNIRRGLLKQLLVMDAYLQMRIQQLASKFELRPAG